MDSNNATNKSCPHQKEMWNERYSGQEYVYGDQPNQYLKEELVKLPIGSILFPADGEGRNSVFAAKQSWLSFAFDQSSEGQKKALQLAAKQQVEITYHVGGFGGLTYQPNQFDVIALIYAHFKGDSKSAYHQQLANYLKPDGHILFEGFSKNHLKYKQKNPNVGGPADLDMLFSMDELKRDFPNFEILHLEEKVIELSEGNFHKGQGSVIRMVARKH